jgi:alpha-D-xyloside xylohydrolase
LAAEPHPTLIEVHDLYRPIFSHGWTFNQVTTLGSAAREGSAVVLTGEQTDGSPMRVRLLAPVEGAFRLTSAFGDAPWPAQTPMLSASYDQGVELSLEAHGSGVRVSRGQLALDFQESTGLFTFSAGGRRLTGNEPLDGAWRMLSAATGRTVREDGRPYAYESLRLELDERIYGLGQQYGSLQKRGWNGLLWNRDTHGFNTSSYLTYHHTPFLWSDRGWGLFINQSQALSVEVGAPSADSLSFGCSSSTLDFFLIHGPTPAQILDRYAELTGRSAETPLWSLGVWMSRCMYESRAEVEAVVERMRAEKLPLDVIHLDPKWLAERKRHQRDGCDFVWDEGAFPEPEAFVHGLLERNVRLSLWENPYVYRDTAMYREGKERGYFLKTSAGDEARPQENVHEAVLPDFTRSEVRGWWKDQHRPYLRMGVAAFKSDYAEGVPLDAALNDGRTGEDFHNSYPLLYNQTVHEAVQEERGEAIVFGRSGYAGSARYPINWTGDPQSSWEGMAGALRAGLSLSLSGVPLWAADIGGFHNPANNSDLPAPEIYIRWAQWGLLISHARFHGVIGREPWLFGEQAVEVVRRFSELRYSLLPYLWTLVDEARRTHMPPVRPLVLQYPGDRFAREVDGEFMLGPCLLVAPILNAEGTARVYLPPGRWFDWWTWAPVEGPRWLEGTWELDRLPLYVRDNSVLPMIAPSQSTNEADWRSIRLECRINGEVTTSVVLPDRSRAQVRLRQEGAGLRVLLDPGPEEWRLTFPGRPRPGNARFNASWRFEGADVVVHAEGRVRGLITW